MGQGAGSRVGTGRFQAMGQLQHSTCTAPHLERLLFVQGLELVEARVVGFPRLRARRLHVQAAA